MAQLFSLNCWSDLFRNTDSATRRAHHLCFSLNTLSLSLSLTLGLFIVFAQLIALLEDVVSKIVNRVGRLHPIHINHALSKHWNNLLHQELPHIKFVAFFQFLNVLLDRDESVRLSAFEKCSLFGFLSRCALLLLPLVLLRLCLLLDE